MSNSAHKSPIVKKIKSKYSSIKKIELVVWETLSRAWYVNEKLARGDNDGDFQNENFYTPIGSSEKEILSAISRPHSKVHFEVDSYLYSIVVE